MRTCRNACAPRATPTCAAGTRPLAKPAAWLALLGLLADLPHSPEVLVPAALGALRQGVRADFGTFTALESRTLRSGTVFSERFSGEALRWLCASRDTAQAAQSTEAMVRSDGESRRLHCLAPEFEDGPLHRRIFQPLRARWSMTAPLLDERGDAHGLLYLHRGPEHGPFTDGEQQLLRQARNALPAVTQPRRAPATSATEPGQVPVRQASLVMNSRGEFISVGQGAEELLYRCARPGPGTTAWGEADARALPDAVRSAAEQLLWEAGADQPAVHGVPCGRVAGLGGDIEFRLEPMQTPGTKQRAVGVHMTLLEPADVALASRLAAWPLAVQQKRMLVTSLRTPDQYALADALGITLNTLKSDVRDMLRRTGFASRQALVKAVLREPAPGVSAMA